MIDPNAISTIRVDQLAEVPFSSTDNIPHEVAGVLKRGTIANLATFISTIIGSSSGVGYLPISVTDGQQLPDVPDAPSFFLCAKGTFLNINGYPDISCTEELNAIMSLSDHWEIAVEIPISVDLSQVPIYLFTQRFTPTGQICTLPTGATAVNAHIDGYIQYKEQSGFESDLNTFTQLVNDIEFKTIFDGTPQILITFYL